MNKIKYAILSTLISLLLISCSGYVAVESSNGRKCSICDGTGFVTEIDSRYLPNIVYINVICVWCHGTGIVSDPYYIESGRIIYNYPYPYRYRRHIIRPHRPAPTTKPQNRIDPNRRNGIHGKAVPGNKPSPHNRGGRK